jgi:hypothetical protein
VPDPEPGDLVPSGETDRTYPCGAMIVEPVPTTPRGPLRRLAGVLGVALPVLLLVAVIAGGALGRDESGQDATAVSPEPPAGHTPEPVPPTASPSLTPPARVAESFRFPLVMHGLPVRGTAQTLARHAQDPLDGLVAVSGYLSIRSLPPECTDRILGPHGALCHRDSLLSDAPVSPFMSGGVDWARIGSHLHPQFPVGIRLPHTAARTVATATGSPLAVVVLGRFGDDRALPCLPAATHCGEEFVVERVAWIDGEDWFRTTVLDPLLDLDVNDDGWRERRLTARAHLDATAILTTAYLLPETLQRIDARAAEALAPGASAPIWYVLGMDLDEDATGERVGRTRWILVDDATGAVIASGGER